MQIHLRPGILFFLLRTDLVTALSFDETIQRLKGATQEGDLLLGPRPGDDRKFIGHVSLDSFEIRRDIFYRSATIPILVGELRTIDGKVIISLRIGISIFPVLMLLGFPLLVASQVSLGLIVLDSALLGVGLGFFAYEAKRSVALLRDIINAA